MSGTNLNSTQAIAISGGNGAVKATAAQMDLQRGHPRSKRGGGTDRISKQIFAKGYSACFAHALGFAMRKAEISMEGVTSIGMAGFAQGAAGVSLGVDLKAELPGLDHAAALIPWEGAHQTRSYSKAIRGNGPVTLVVA